MVIIMAANATRHDVDAIRKVVADNGGEAFVSCGGNRTIIGLTGDVGLLQSLGLRAMPGVQDTIRISTPYKLVSSENHARRSVVRVAGVPIGPGTLTLIAGPCAVETHDQTLGAAMMARAAGASLLRGGAYKPRTSPYSFQGLGETGLKILAEVRAETGLPIVTEVVDPRDAELVASYADMLQIGTRNTQNFGLLQAASDPGHLRRPAIPRSLAPAHHRRPVPFGRQPTPRPPADPGRHRRRRRWRDHRRSPRSGGLALRWPSGARP